MYTIFKKKQVRLLLITSLVSSNAYSIDMIGMRDLPYTSVFKRLYAIPNSHSEVKKLTNVDINMEKNKMRSVSQTLASMMKEGIQFGTRYTKLATGYGAYSIASLLVGSSYIAKAGSVTSLYGGKFLTTVGALDDVGKFISTNGYDFSTYGLTFLESNKNVNKNTVPHYTDNIFYGLKESIGVTSVLGGGLVRGLGGITRIVGVASKFSGDISDKYTAPSLAALGRMCENAGNDYYSKSKSIFASL